MARTFLRGLGAPFRASILARLRSQKASTASLPRAPRASLFVTFLRLHRCFPTSAFRAGLSQAQRRPDIDDDDDDIVADAYCDIYDDGDQSLHSHQDRVRGSEPEHGVRWGGGVIDCRIFTGSPCNGNACSELLSSSFGLLCPGLGLPDRLSELLDLLGLRVCTADHVRLGGGATE